MLSTDKSSGSNKAEPTTTPTLSVAISDFNKHFFEWYANPIEYEFGYTNTDVNEWEDC